jgi:integrase/recombinase XerD
VASPCRSRASTRTSPRCAARWASRQDLIPYDPASNLDLPRLPDNLPRSALRVDEAERVLAQPDITTPLGLRDRAIMEVLYSTGMRRHEVQALHLYDVDAVKETVMVRQGKGRRDRVVPIGQRALAWLEKYISEVRPAGALRTTASSSSPSRARRCRRLHRDEGRPVRASGSRRQAHNLFRHTAATLMLENGADIRYIQEMLGHANLGTTQIYTRVSIQKLKEIHTAAHPAAAGPRPGGPRSRARGARPALLLAAALLASRAVSWRS